MFLMRTAHFTGQSSSAQYDFIIFSPFAPLLLPFPKDKEKQLPVYVIGVAVFLRLSTKNAHLRLFCTKAK